MTRRDYVTNTVEDAARFERMYGEEPYDDRPTLADVCGDLAHPTDRDGERPEGPVRW